MGVPVSRFLCPSRLVSRGYWDIFSWEVKRAGYETGHSPLSIFELKNMWVFISTPSYAYKACCPIRYYQSQL
jgi:hypothetical protein